MTAETLGPEARACQCFLERHPEYEATPGNSRILIGELLRLSEEEGLSAASVSTVETAFNNKRSLLKLKELPPPETPLNQSLEWHSQEYFRELSPEEKETLGKKLAALTPRERDNLPDHLARWLVGFEFKKAREPKQLDPASEILLPLFVELGYADSIRNRAIIAGWLNARGLEYTIPNLNLAIDETKEHLDYSPQAIDRMDAKTYKQKVVDPLVKKEQAAKAKEIKHDRGNPPGFSYVSWLHGQ